MTAGSVAAPTIVPLKVSHGQPKHVIDSSTRIEMASATADMVIYYTLDRTRPNPARKHTYDKAKTYRYRNPFTVSIGRVAIKAMACSVDHTRESSVVTKNFTVLKAEDNSIADSDSELDADIEYESPPAKPPSISAQLRQRLSMGSRASMHSSTEGMATAASDLHPPSSPQQPAASRSLAQASVASLGHGSGKSIGQSTSVTVGGSGLRPTTAEIPAPVCLYCKCPRSKDTTHQYCTHCGSRLPALPEVDSAPPLQVAVCSGCRAHLPLGSTSCVVCEHTTLHPTPIPTIHAQAQLQALEEGKIVCLICGTRNRPDSSHCWTCEKPLPPDVTPPLPPAQTPPPLPNPTVLRPISGTTYMMCGLCGRVNVSDARFCDWCGSKPAGSQLMVECVGCQTPNQWHCRYCHACGGIIKAPLRPDVELSSTMKMPATVELDKNAWIPVVEIADKGPVTGTMATQTDGIFYPSARTIGNQKGSEFIKKMIHITARDRLPKLHGHSPGKGLWRMQMEHVCTHLRAHCQSSNHFQSTIGKPQLGKLLSAQVDQDSDKLDLHLAFALKQLQPGRPEKKWKSGLIFEETRHLNTSNGSLRRTSSCGNISSKTPPTNQTTPTTQSAQTTPTTQSAQTTPTTQSAQTTPTKNPPAAETLKQKHRPHRRRTTHSSQNKKSLSGDVKKLCKELLGTGQGRRDVVYSLVQKGADVNAVSPDSGLPLLSLAASHGHLDCIATLVVGGAKVNAPAKTTGNTALHEAVLGGPGNIPCLEALLGHGANARLRNGSGLTPCDLAMKLKHDEIVTCFATYVGAGLLDNLYKYQPSLTL